MEKLISLTAVAAPLPIDNLDTDQIMPKQFLRGIDKAGLGRGALYNMRFDGNGAPRPECVFNRPGFEKTAVIAAGPNFGCGSSREHAVWGLMQMGIRAVIAPGFGEIFSSNSFTNGQLAARVTPEAAEEILAALSDEEPRTATLDVRTREIRIGDRVWPFELGERHRTMLLEGLDMTGTTLRELDVIRAFREKHEKAFPWMAGLPAGAKKRLAG